MIELTLAAIFGLVIGSFLNVCIHRIPLGESIVKPGSRCPGCRHAIRWYDNVPVLAWLWLGGRCRSCRMPISLRYPLVELITGGISLLLAMQYGLGGQWAIYFAFSAAVIVLVLIDLDHRILPDVITLNGIWLGLGASLYLVEPGAFAERLYRMIGTEVGNPLLLSLVGSLAGAVFGGGLLWLVREAFFWLRGVEGMGFGDVKMMAMVGAFLGVPLTLFTILVGSVVGSIIGIAVIQLFGKSRTYELPFGTFLGAGAILAVLYGDQIVRLYLDNFFPAIV
jgi:leader peptidase (prepilin peptidase)/N-methyltransferase